MSLPPNKIPDGVYKISNVAYPTMVADLIYPGGVNGTIGGYTFNDDSKRMQWLVTQLQSQDGITLANQEIATYANVLQTAVNQQVVGNPDAPVIWTVTPTDSEGEFLIFVDGSPNVWTLADENDGTPITVEPIDVSPRDNQMWTFALV